MTFELRDIATNVGHTPKQLITSWLLWHHVPDLVETLLDAIGGEGVFESDGMQHRVRYVADTDDYAVRSIPLV